MTVLKPLPQKCDDPCPTPTKVVMVPKLPTTVCNPCPVEVSDRPSLLPTITTETVIVDIYPDIVKELFTEFDCETNPAFQTYFAPILTGRAPSGKLGVAYYFKYRVTHGLGPYTYKIKSGDLPEGLIFNEVTSEITGIPTVPGRFNYFVTVVDSTKHSNTISCYIVIEA